MLYNHFTEKLLGLQGIIIKNVEIKGNLTVIYAEMEQKEHIYFKNSRNLLLKRFNNLTDEQKQQVNIMLYVSVNLSRAHWYKEEFLEILNCSNRESAKLKGMSPVEYRTHSLTT